MRGEAFWGLKNPENSACPLDPRRGVAPGPHQGPLSGPLDPTPLRRSALLGHKLFLFSTPQLQILHTSMFLVRRAVRNHNSVYCELMVIPPTVYIIFQFSRLLSYISSFSTILVIFLSFIIH